MELDQDIYLQTDNILSLYYNPHIHGCITVLTNSPQEKFVSHSLMYLMEMHREHPNDELLYQFKCAGIDISRCGRSSTREIIYQLFGKRQPPYPKNMSVRSMDKTVKEYNMLDEFHKLELLCKWMAIIGFQKNCTVYDWGEWTHRLNVLLPVHQSIIIDYFSDIARLLIQKVILDPIPEITVSQIVSWKTRINGVNASFEVGTVSPTQVSDLTPYFSHG